MSDVDSNKVERLYVSEEGEVSLLPHRPDLPCEGLWGGKCSRTGLHSDYDWMLV